MLWATVNLSWADFPKMGKPNIWGHLWTDKDQRGHYKTMIFISRLAITHVFAENCFYASSIFWVERGWKESKMCEIKKESP